MKKISSLIVTIVAFILMGCGSEKGEEDSLSRDTNGGDFSQSSHGIRLKHEYVFNGQDEYKITYEYDNRARMIRYTLLISSNNQLIIKQIHTVIYKNNQVDKIVSKWYDNNDNLFPLKEEYNYFYNNSKQIKKYEYSRTSTKYPSSNEKTISIVNSWDGIHETKKTKTFYDENNTVTQKEVYEATWDENQISTLKKTFIPEHIPEDSTYTYSFETQYYYDEEGRKNPDAYIQMGDTHKYGKNLNEGEYLIVKAVTTNSILGEEITITIHPLSNPVFNNQNLLISANTGKGSILTTYEYEEY